MTKADKPAAPICRVCLETYSVRIVEGVAMKVNEDGTPHCKPDGLCIDRDQCEGCGQCIHTPELHGPGKCHTPTFGPGPGQTERRVADQPFYTQGGVPLKGEREIAEAVFSAVCLAMTCNEHDVMVVSRDVARAICERGIALDREAMAQAILSALQEEPYLEKAEYLDLTMAAYTAIDAILAAGRGRA